ncbi:alcohol oxidase-like protein [Amylocystis lapponica]|nr:alcohol oxidase-like protein [Amylocystis lapponica]
MQPETESDTYDIIIAGGPLSLSLTLPPTLTYYARRRHPGSVLAARSPPQTPRDNPRPRGRPIDTRHRTHTQPARYLTHLRPGSTTVRFNVARKSDAVRGREVVVPCGRCVSRCTRARRRATTMTGSACMEMRLGADALLPLMRKCETYQVQPGLAYAWFLDVARAYDPAREVAEDPNDLAACDVYARWPKWISAESGARSDVAHCYLYPRVHAPGSNLHLLADCAVIRVLFSETRATGVEYLPGAGAPLRTVQARRLVVLSAGAFGSPAILERSGIGADAHLCAAGIPRRVSLPGVGENFHDHLIMIVPFRAAEDVETLDGIARGNEHEVARWTAQWEKDGSGLMAHNGLDAGVKIRPNAAERATMGPAFARRWEEYYAAAPDKPVLILVPPALYIGPDPNPPEKCFSMLYYSMHPAATGRVHVTSADDPAAPPDFDPAYLTRDEDLAVMTWAYKRSREFARRMPCYRGELVADHPAFSAESGARCVAHARPVPVDVPDIVYSADDERVLEEYTRERVGTAWHALGTCAMRPREKGGVVDERLNVYGIQGLKIADLSIAPSNVASNTYSTAVLIGEKAAVMVAEEMGISGI